MRRDMARVLVGRPRRGMRLRIKRRKLHQGQLRWPENTLRREPMSRGRGTKCLNENLAPLERYLRSQLGRPWDKVYSELSQRLRPTSAVQQHVRDHLADFVAVRTRLEGGQVLGPGTWDQPMVLTRPGYGPAFYVDPRSGLLCARPCRRERSPISVPDRNVRWDGPWRRLRRIDSVWYAFRLAPIPATAGELGCARDRVLGQTLEALLLTTRSDDPLYAAYGRRGVFAAEKRQLSKRELRDIDRLPCSLRRVDR